MMVSGACFFLTSDAKPLVSIDTHEQSIRFQSGGMLKLMLHKVVSIRAKLAYIVCLLAKQTKAPISTQSFSFECWDLGIKKNAAMPITHIYH